jgi:hypothetical protein
MLDLLLERGFHIGSDALVHAAKHGRADMIRKLLAAARAKVKGRPPDLKSAMRAACAAGNETSLRVLVEEGGFDVRLVFVCAGCVLPLLPLLPFTTSPSSTLT